MKNLITIFIMLIAVGCSKSLTKEDVVEVIRRGRVRMVKKSFWKMELLCGMCKMRNCGKVNGKLLEKKFMLVMTNLRKYTKLNQTVI